MLEKALKLSSTPLIPTSSPVNHIPKIYPCPCSSHQWATPLSAYYMDFLLQQQLTNLSCTKTPPQRSGIFASLVTF